MNSPIKVVQPTGILDSTQAPKFRQEIARYLEDQAQIVIVDFQDVTFMDSSGLGALVLSLKKVKTAGAQLFLCSINDQVRMLFELTDMDRVFEIFPSREAAEQAISQKL